jgi:hypothetical protein
MEPIEPTMDDAYMREILEQMRRDLVSPTSARACTWALGRIATLEADLRRGDRAFAQAPFNAMLAQRRK